MMKFLRLFYSSEGQGNMSYSSSGSLSGGGPITAANDGLTETANVAKLGQAVGAAGDPAKLLESREIPFNGNELFFGKNDGLSAVIAFDPTSGISIDTLAGNLATIQLFDGVDWEVTGDGAGNFLIGAVSGGHFITMKSVGGIIYTDWIVVNSGFGSNVREVAAPLAVTVGISDSVIAYDTTTGPGTVSIAPLSLLKRTFFIKKTDAGANSITITPVVPAMIYGGAGPVASFVFSGPGESIQLQVNNDGSKIYIL
jgi:hypothetical protein